MRILSLTQPWATLVAIGAKRIETRSWGTPYRGDVAIHATKGFPPACRALCPTPAFESELRLAGYRSWTDLPTGEVLAVATLRDVVLFAEPQPAPVLARFDEDPYELAFGDFSPGRRGWLLDNVRRLNAPVPCQGAQGLRTLDAYVEALVLEQIGWAA